MVDEPKKDFVQRKRSFFRACFWNKDCRQRQCQSNFDSISNTSKTGVFPFRILKAFSKTTFFWLFPRWKFLWHKKSFLERFSQKKKKTEKETLTLFINVKKKVLSQTNIAFCEASLSTIFNVFLGNGFFGSRLWRGLKTGRRKKFFHEKKLQAPKNFLRYFFFHGTPASTSKKSFLSYTRHKITEKLRGRVPLVKQSDGCVRGVHQL